MYKQTVEEMKQFLSKTADYYRPAYGKRSVNHPRRCVFFGTTNTNEILKDATGNKIGGASCRERVSSPV